MAKGKYTGMVLLDLQKAFDTVDHEILMNKLKAMGIRSSAWFRACLTNRKQVKINDTASEKKNNNLWSATGKHPGPPSFLMLYKCRGVKCLVQTIAICR